MILRASRHPKSLKSDRVAVSKGLNSEDLQLNCSYFRIKPPATPMEIRELLAAHEDEETTDSSRTLYQRKVGSLLFAAIATRPDIAFAVSRLSRFNQRPGKRHHEAADRVFH